jgi:hypothetical protein
LIKIKQEHPAGDTPSILSSEDDMIESRNRVQPRLFFGGGFMNPFVSRSILTLFAYTATTNITVSMSVVSTCIPVASFSTSTATGTACTAAAAGRKRRSFWEDVEELESIHPSQVQE